MRKKLALCILSLMTAPAYANVEQKIELLEQQLLQLKQQLQEDKLIQNKLVEENKTVQSTLISQESRIKKSINPEHDVKFYGHIRLDGAVDFESSAGGTFGKLNTVPLQGTQGNRSEFNLTASRIGVDLKKTIGEKVLTAKLEGDFWDGSSGDGKFRVRHAYIDYNNWLLGQTTSLVTNLETATESVDYTAFLGTSWVRLPQVRYNFNINSEHNLKVGLEYVSSRSSELPALTTKYTYKQNNLTTLAQGFVNEKRAQLDNKDIDKLAWGVGAGLKYQATTNTSLQGHYYHIKGDQKFIPYSAQGSNANGGTAGGDFSVELGLNDLDLNEFDSFVLGFSHRFNPYWRMNLAASLFNYDDKNDFAKNNQNMNKKLTDFAANIFFTPVKNFDLGLEYHLGNREIFSGDDVDVSRLNMAAIYKF